MKIDMTTPILDLAGDQIVETHADGSKHPLILRHLIHTSMQQPQPGDEALSATKKIEMIVQALEANQDEVDWSVEKIVLAKKRIEPFAALYVHRAYELLDPKTPPKAKANGR